MTMSMLRVSLLSAASLALLSSAADAASFYIQEQSVSGMGTAFAGAVADTPDASTVFYNPAGMTELDRLEFYIGGNLLLPNANYNDTGSTRASTLGGGTVAALGPASPDNPFDAAVVPNAFLSVPVLQDKLWFGLGVTAPFGLTNEYDTDFVGRYNSSENELTVIDVAPSLAYKVNPWLSIGGGVNVQHANAKLENAIPNPVLALQSTATDGRADLSGDDTSVGYNIGLQLKPVEGTKIGMHYRTGVSHTLEGRLVTVLPTALPGGLAGLSGVSLRSNGSAELDLPNIASLGLSQKVGDKFTLLGSVNWYEWSNFDDIPILTDANAVQAAAFRSVEQGYVNTWGVAIGGRYDVNEKLQLKAGFQYDQTPTVDEFRSTRIPDGDRTWYAAGLTYAITEGISVDLSGMYVDVSKEDIDITDTVTYAPGVTTTNRTVGETDGSVAIISTGLRFRF